MTYSWRSREIRWEGREAKKGNETHKKKMICFGPHFLFMCLPACLFLSPLFLSVWSRGWSWWGECSHTWGWANKKTRERGEFVIVCASDHKVFISLRQFSLPFSLSLSLSLARSLFACSCFLFSLCIFLLLLCILCVHLLFSLHKMRSIILSFQATSVISQP